MASRFITLLFILCQFSCDAQTNLKTFTGSKFPGADSLLNFISKNKSRASVCIQKDGSVIAKLNESKQMPLASTVKIIVALEFAKQVGAGVFTKSKKVELSELNKYYVPNTDGNAHPQWIEYERSNNHIIDGGVKLIDVARGMMMFSSNANTEYLIDLLGMDNVNSNIKLLGLKQHTIIYPLVSSLFMYQNPYHVKEDKVLAQIKVFPEAVYTSFIVKIHDQLKHDTVYKSKFRPQDLSVKMQKLWSDRLPSSTTQEYAKIMNILNNRTQFDKATYAVLPEVLEMIMENPANQSWLQHSGTKGGSTMFVLTEAFYATLKSGSKYEFAIFFNNLQGNQVDMLGAWINDFRLALLTEESFRNRLKF